MIPFYLGGKVVAARLCGIQVALLDSAQDFCGFVDNNSRDKFAERRRSDSITVYAIVQSMHCTDD